MSGKQNNGVSQERVLEELAAIGFARVTDILCVEGDTLKLKDGRQLSGADQAAVASIERTASGLKVKLYDKLKALELLGKHYGMFGGKQTQRVEANNLLEAILKATEQEVDLSELPEIQQAAAAGHDLVESSQTEGA